MQSGNPSKKKRARAAGQNAVAADVSRRLKIGHLGLDSWRGIA